MFMPTFSFNGIIGGENAARGEFPWQLSQQRLGASWSHSCGASLIGTNKALSAAHCMDGAAFTSIRVIAGLHVRSDTTGSQTVNCANYVMHNQYNQGSATFANDIAIINLAGNVVLGGAIGLANLASDPGNTFAGQTCVISGWGRTSSSNVLPDILQKASIQVITTAQCQSQVQGIGNAWDGHICLRDANNQIGSCNGDSGGPLNCGTQVAGVTSWGISSLGNCRQDYPSVYTRVSYYIGWINGN